MNAALELGGTSVQLRGVMRRSERMAKHSVWGVGGVADSLYIPADLEDLGVFLAQLPRAEPLLWIGLGSNLLVRDGGVRGTVVLTAGPLNRLRLTEAGRVRAEAGVACPKVARFCARNNLCGGEFLAGIPGTVGGALAMNAGAFGAETWDIVRGVETIDRRGLVRARSVDDFTVAYRQVEGPGEEWFVAATLGPTPGSGEASALKIRELLQRRAASQPTGQRSCGSVFRNPPGQYAARLIEACGLKGTRIGGAVVSEKHANFFLNTGDATAANIEALITRVRREVERRRGVQLVSEVHIVGDKD